MIELQWLSTFCAVVERGSFTKASELVYRTQPTVSSQISALEKYYGVTLFDRSQREIVLTEEGSILYSYAKKILKLVDESRDKLDDFKSVVRGNLVIGASTIPGTYILPTILSKFKQKYPAVQVAVQISNSKSVITKILERELEVGAVGEKTKDVRLRYVELAKDRIVLVVPLNHPWVKKESIFLDNLLEVPIIYREEGSGTRSTVEKVLRAKGVKGLKIVMELGSTESVKEGVKAGLGVSFVSEWAIKDSSLKEVKVRGLDIVRNFYIVFLKKGPKSRTSQSFIEFMEK